MKLHTFKSDSTVTDGPERQNHAKYALRAPVVQQMGYKCEGPEMINRAVNRLSGLSDELGEDLVQDVIGNNLGFSRGYVGVAGRAADVGMTERLLNER